MNAEEIVREALRDGMKLRAPARVEKFQRAESALNAIRASRAAQAEVVAVAREINLALDGGTQAELLKKLRGVMSKYDAVVAGLPGIVQ